MKSKELITGLMITLLIVTIGLIALLIVQVRTKAYECQQNPFQYGVDELSRKYNENSFCAINPDMSSATCVVATKEPRVFTSNYKK